MVISSIIFGIMFLLWIILSIWNSNLNWVPDSHESTSSEGIDSEMTYIAVIIATLIGLVILSVTTATMWPFAIYGIIGMVISVIAYRNRDGSLLENLALLTFLWLPTCIMRILSLFGSLFEKVIDRFTHAKFYYFMTNARK